MNTKLRLFDEYETGVDLKVKKLKLKQYRNIEQLELEPCETVNIIYGDNAQGKTNVMEAIWMCSGNPSFRTTKTQDFILFDHAFSEILLRFSDVQREQEIKIRFTGKKEWKRNDVPLKKASELIGQFYVVLFTPVDLELADGSPKIRRRFMDVAIAQTTPQYGNYLENYEKVLEQRNALLKECFRFPDLRDTMEVWDLQLAKIGTILSIYRGDYVKKLKTIVTRIYDGLSSNQETLEITYQSSVFEEIESIQTYQDCYIQQYYQALQQQLEQDLKYGFTSVGIHRDDLEFQINGLPIKTFGSRGQIRSSVLALKLAEAELLTTITGEHPVILLDDVMSELDMSRQDYILNHVKDKQVFITCCDIFNTIKLESGMIFQIQDGKILSQRQVSAQESNRSE